MGHCRDCVCDVWARCQRSPVEGTGSLMVGDPAHHRALCCACWGLVCGMTVLMVHGSGKWFEVGEVVPVEEGVYVRALGKKDDTAWSAAIHKGP